MKNDYITVLKSLINTLASVSFVIFYHTNIEIRSIVSSLFLNIVNPLLILLKIYFNKKNTKKRKYKNFSIEFLLFIYILELTMIVILCISLDVHIVLFVAYFCSIFVSNICTFVIPKKQVRNIPLRQSKSLFQISSMEYDYIVKNNILLHRNEIIQIIDVNGNDVVVRKSNGEEFQVKKWFIKDGYND
ncbi:hypothetical protein CWI38_0132p0050 [Hamiltosporidium tvaerminnensis]|uniref:Uncharacterized protein n=2 Tax=Hamiltosporidium TaxID=1176354 RepID=A0A4Q9LI32_9MICR|nr:hypothetical protein CWI36_0222p0030 [Hamiltosporidium magnivora]TBU08318.1 hypothetical protein CWI36_0154p0010 [Hamiltosporidium magnivora]TBU20104.1 hypothetical protein CWI38_0132p0050 [Hamiltosporidium tvaerminnensis]